MSDAMSLQELHQFMRRVVALNFNDPVWVSCELAQVSESRGHHYLTLVQKDEAGIAIVARANAACWRSTHAQLRRRLKSALDLLLQEGVAVRLQVQPEFHEVYGYKLIVQDVDPSYTVGQLALQRQATLDKLRQKDLLERNGLLDLPPVLQRIAVLSSPTAAGLQDYYAQLAGNPYQYTLTSTLFPTAMQSVHTIPEMRKQLKAIAKRRAEFDAVVIIRGGGSRVDLLVFDDYDLAKAVAECPLPVFTGIGHDIDQSVLDAVSYAALKTPTAVADFLLQYNVQFEQTIFDLADLVQRRGRVLLRAQRDRLERQGQQLRLQALAQTREAATQLHYLTATLPRLAWQRTTDEEKTLAHLERAVRLVSPAEALRRGYSLTTFRGKVVTDPAQLKRGDRVRTRTAGGDFESVVDA